MLITSLLKAGVITPPPFVEHSTVYLTMMGSYAYGVSNDTSDMDVYGFCIPPKTLLFPHLAGEIIGFGNQTKRFEQYQEHHIKDPTGKHASIDLSVYSIVKYFQLCMENNPNMLDSLFTPQHCVLYSTQISELVRLNRRIFLHKGSYHKFIGYAHSQLHKMSSSTRTGKRKEVFDKWGFDLKFAYHLMRLSYECEQILTEADLDLEKNREHLKAVRRGEVNEADIRAWFSDKEKHLQKLYETSTLQHSPDEKAIKALLLNCLEQHYGSLEGAVDTEDKLILALQKIQEAVDSVRKQING